MKYTPERGDIVWLDFDPSAGKEIMKRRPAFVISRKQFNAYTEMAVVAPITSTIRGVKLEVILPDTLKTDGAILVYQFRVVDFVERHVAFIEKAPESIAQQVAKIAQVIVQ